MSMMTRLKASLVLTPAILALLCWIVRFSGVEEVARIGITAFTLWAIGVSFAVAYLVTLYVSVIATLFRR